MPQNIWRFLKAESDVDVPRLMGMAALAGLSNALLLAVINSATNAVAGGTAADAAKLQEKAARTIELLSGKAPPEVLQSALQEVQRAAELSTSQWPPPTLFLKFVVTILLYILAQRYILRVSNTEVERIVGKLRRRIADEVRKADLQPLQELGQAQIFTVMTRDTQTISQAASPTIIAVQSAVMVLFTGGYIASLSPWGLMLTLLIVGFALLFHFRKREEIAARLLESTATENEFFGSLQHLLEGFKEVKLNNRRGRELNEYLIRLADSAVELKTRTAVAFADHYIFSQSVFYIIIGAMVFVLPKLVRGTYAESITQITAAILFMIGPLSILIGSLPVFSAANVAVENIARLEQQLVELQSTARGEETEEPPPDFSEIRFDQVHFSYRDQAGVPLFRIGPINLTVKRGEILFIVGGNGSGKSTFLKLLTSLYYPESGDITIDSHSAAEVGYSRYRQLFSAIFTDYHLFDRLFGVDVNSEEQVRTLIHEMDLDAKTSYQDGRFLNQELSTGQRKRLALIVSLLEDRPVYIFDEWAADQDPTFRKHFYTEILPNLRSEHGKTIIAATHDDRYFDVADRVVKMENGQLTFLRGSE